MAETVRDLLERLEHDELTPDGAEWTPWPGGWRNEISTALIDAVFSARAAYKTRGGAGVHAQVVRWRELHADHRDTLAGLVEEIRSSGPEAWARSFGNMQHSPGRGRRRPDAPWKSAAVLEAAEGLAAIPASAGDRGVDHAGDVTLGDVKQVGAVLGKVPGIGRVTADYFLMLLGFPGVKADTMIRRYLQGDDGRPPGTAAAVSAVTAAAGELGCDVVDLEHSIWHFESRRPRR